MTAHANWGCKTYQTVKSESNRQKFERHFGRKRVVLPVVHAVSDVQALRNVGIAERAGADGVFLINHAITSDELFKIAQKVIQEFPKIWIGLNVLDLHPIEVFDRLPTGIRGVWTDNALVREGQFLQEEAHTVQAKQGNWEGLYFGGIAFKYQPAVNDLRTVADLARGYMDVVTTSGEKTGNPPAPEKMQEIRAAIRDAPMAIASGISSENVSLFPETDCFLVATSISKTFTELDENLTANLIRCVARLRPGKGA